MDSERCHHRFPVFGARLRGPSFDAPVVNLSKTGLAIRVDRELTPGDSYSAWLETESDRSRLQGTVVWCRAAAGSGRKASGPLYDAGLSVETIECAPAVTTEPPESPSEPEAAPAALPVRSVPRLKASGMRLRSEELDAEVLNFSSRGLAVETDRPLALGRIYEAELDTNEGIVAIRAMVVWCAPKPADSSDPGVHPSRYEAGLSIRSARQDAVRPSAAKREAAEQPGVEMPDAPALDDVAPWLAEVTAELEGKRGGSTGRRVGWRTALAGGLLAVGVAMASWFWARAVPEAPTAGAGSAAVGEAPATASETSERDSAEAAEVAAAEVTLAPQPPAALEATGSRGALYPRAGVNVRSGPGLDFSVVRTTVDGERLPYRSKEGEWYRLDSDEALWLHESTIQVVEQAPGAS